MKQPLSEEAEQRISSIKTSKARSDILISLEKSYYCEISDKYDGEINKAENIPRAYKVPDQKKDVEKIVAAIKTACGKKYKLRHEVLCKIANGNDLTFVLEPDLDLVPEVSRAVKTKTDLQTKKAAELKSLASWKRKQMINIANGLDFDEFKPQA